MAKNQKGGKNSKDANNKGAKNGKGNKGDKQNAAAEAPQPKKVRVPGPKPDYKHPKAKTNETFQTLEGAWNGYCGLVSVGGMQFRFFSETSESGEKTNRVRLVSAPIKTALSDLGDYTTSIKLESLKDSSFVSDFEKGDLRYEVQAKLWKFLVRTFSAAGFKPSHHKKPDVQTAPPVSKVVEHKHESKTSSSIADFDLKKKGLYRFEVSGSYAMISIEPVKGVVHAPQLGNVQVAQVMIKLVSVGKGHQLSGCKIGTFLYYNEGLFNGKAPVFKGATAEDRSKLYEYLSGVRSFCHRSVVNRTLHPQDRNTELVIGEKVVLPLPRNRVMEAV